MTSLKEIRNRRERYLEAFKEGTLFCCLSIYLEDVEYLLNLYDDVDRKLENISYYENVRLGVFLSRSNDKKCSIKGCDHITLKGFNYKLCYKHTPDQRYNHE